MNRFLWYTHLTYTSSYQSGIVLAFLLDDWPSGGLSLRGLGFGASDPRGSCVLPQWAGKEPGALPCQCLWVSPLGIGGFLFNSEAVPRHRFAQIGKAWKFGLVNVLYFIILSHYIDIVALSLFSTLEVGEIKLQSGQEREEVLIIYSITTIFLTLNYKCQIRVSEYIRSPISDRKNSSKCFRTLDSISSSGSHWLKVSTMNVPQRLHPPTFPEPRSHSSATRQEWIGAPTFPFLFLLVISKFQ